jgi:hypothetical protein
MKVDHGEDVYLIQWLGDHRNSAQWQTKSYIKCHHPKQLVHLQQFDNNFAKKCSEIRSNSFNHVKKPIRRRSSNK